ncbi:hypothetical protein [Leptodesmis sp.]|uniref:hypothetical protein n=1 Tax=Leptodesmis sp. TaxID=3100501 RepID=UPI003D0CC384
MLPCLNSRFGSNLGAQIWMLNGNNLGSAIAELAPIQDVIGYRDDQARLCSWRL